MNTINLIEREINRILTCAHPPSQASYCMGMIDMASVDGSIGYRDQDRLRMRVDEVDREYWRSFGLPV